jgi:hypothetical protein
MPQSPAFNPSAFNSLQEYIYQKFLQASHVTDLAGIHALPFPLIIAANELTISNAPYGATGFGPVIDGIFVPQLPTLPLAEGRRERNVHVIFLDYNVNERLPFIDLAIQNTSTFNIYLISFSLTDDSQIFGTMWKMCYILLYLTKLHGWL